MGDQNLIPDPDGGEVTENVTPDAGSVPQGGTLTKGTEDVDKKLQETVQKFERDIAGLKSTFQKNEYELRKQLQAQKEEYDKYVREVKVSQMDEVQRKQFEAQELIERNRNFEEEARKARRELEERIQKEQYRDFFVSVGVPATSLKLDGDLSALVNSGYLAWGARTKELEAKLAELTKKTSGEDAEDKEVTPPNVTVGKGKPSKGPTWEALIKQYGSMEAVYRKVERGELPYSVLPVE